MTGSTESAEFDDGPGFTPADAFGALANEHRVAIVQAFAEADEGARPTLSFSEIYEAIELSSTSQLSYHLDHLIGSFLRSTEGGYELTATGENVLQAIEAGAYTDEPQFEPITLSGECPACHETELRGAYSDGLLAVTCTACGANVVRYDLPPSAVVGRDERDVLESCDLRVRHEYAVAVAGTCPDCGGGCDVFVEQDDTYEEPREYAIADCGHCGNRVFAPLAAVVLWHPAVISLYWDAGVDATAIPFWQLQSVIAAWDVDVQSREPFAATVTVRGAEASLTVAVDDDLDVSVAAPVKDV
jgi:hypothetical protein